MLLDIAVAFPSLAMDWLWALFQAMRLPAEITRALMLMYSELFASIIVGVVVGPPIAIRTERRPPGMPS